MFDCRDPKDNKYLELAAAGRAEIIISGDDDLLVLHPWRGVAIIGPTQFVALHNARMA
jgi:predicted nucleic acid-binding protein